MRVFLTGGTGLLGSHVAERLRAQDGEVVALARADSDTRFLERLGCSLVAGDVRDNADHLARLMDGCDAVVHGAALVHARASWPRVRAVNVEGTVHVLRGAAVAGVRTVLHLSSVAVYGRSDGPVDEDTPIDTALPPGDLYARSKRESEAAARREATAGGLRLTVLRPAAVYGERDRLLAPRVAALARRPFVPVLGSGHNTLPVVYAGNVADAVQRCLERPGERWPRTYDVGLDHPLTQEALLVGMARALGSDPRLLHLPAPLVWGTAELGDRLGVSMPGAGDLALSRFLRLALADNPYPSRRIRREIDWHPPFGHDEALRRTAEWIEGRRQGGEAQ